VKKKSKNTFAARRDEIVGILLVAVAVSLALSIATYRGPIPEDADVPGIAHNAFGPVGAYVAGWLTMCAGLMLYALAVVLALWGVRLFVHRSPGHWPMRLGGLVLLAATFSGLLDRYGGVPADQLGRGGLMGSYVADRLAAYFGSIGSSVILVAMALVAVLMVSDFLFIYVILWIGALAGAGWRAVGAIWRPRPVQIPEHMRKAAGQRKNKESGSAPARERQLEIVLSAPVEKAATSEEPVENPEPEVPKLAGRPKRGTPYVKPPLSILADAERLDSSEMSRDLRAVSSLLEETLEHFGIEANVVQVTRGPVITRYELEPAPGIKVAKFTSLADDLALALKAHRVRVEAPIPGKGRIGIEVPNEKREPVVIKDCLTSEAFRSMTSPIKIVLGKDVAGDPVVIDLVRMPHLLIAGATGSGKTVCVKAIISSILFNAKPSEVELLLIDPKMVELSVFNGVSHLISPVIANAKKAAAVLGWLTGEMDRRYRLLARLGMRNVQVYNERIESGDLTPEQVRTAAEEVLPLVNAREQQVGQMTYIVVVVDEMADLMALCRADVEDAVTRLSQLARAVGIHLIVATQRPSVDVLTGVIKNNFPARISFQVASKFDSRTILDSIGSERLTGSGDMLYLEPGAPKPVRIQGAFISDDEIARLMEFQLAHGESRHRTELLDLHDDTISPIQMARQKKDDLFDDAIRVVRETGQASITMLQRRLRIGYARAANIIDTMELDGLVGPAQGSKPREILIKPLPHESDVFQD